MAETDLYLPVKRFLEKQGYCVKGEVKNCDVVGVRADEPPIIVELKQIFNLPLILQGLDRLTMSDHVYLAIGAPSADNKATFWKQNQKDLIKLCRRLGLGLMVVETTRGEHGFVEVHCDPVPYAPRKAKSRTGLLLKEFAHRHGDLNVGGSNKRAIITAYRQDALRCLTYIAQNEQARMKDIKQHTGVGRAGAILQRDVYGWFLRVSRGVYSPSPKGYLALEEFSDVVAEVQKHELVNSPI